MKYLQTFSRGFFGLTVSEHTKPLAKPLATSEYEFPKAGSGLLSRMGTSTASTPC